MTDARTLPPQVMQLIENVIEAISKNQYRDLWESDPPPFDAFVSHLRRQLTKIAPNEISGISVDLSCQTKNRIAVGGEIEANDGMLRIWGQIVWVPKHQFFRGKLGTRKTGNNEPTSEPEDSSVHFVRVTNTTKDLNRCGRRLNLAPISLVQTFGEPDEADDFKVSGIYLFEGNAGSAYRLHDYEATDLYWDAKRHPEAISPGSFWSSKKSYRFRVAGNKNPDAFLRWLRKEIGR